MYDLISESVDELVGKSFYSGNLECNLNDDLNDNFIQKCSNDLIIPKGPLNIKIPKDYIIPGYIISDQIKRKERNQDSMHEGIPLYLPFRSPVGLEHKIEREEPSNRGIIDYSI